MHNRTPEPTDTEALLRLSLAPGLGPLLIARALEAFGSPQAALTATPDQFRTLKGVGHKAESIAAALGSNAPAAREEFAAAKRAGATVIGITGPAYPALLKQVPAPPPVLSVRGTLTGADRHAVAIVGPRRPSAYAIEQAERFGAAFAQAGLTVVSGGARGVDAAAHRATLRAGGRTIAVLGCGISHAYPPEHAGLFDEISDARGAVVSEFPAATTPTPGNFPRRNRVVSGLSLGVLVVEAGEKSGALITARLAVEEHNREAMALPNRVDAPSAVGSNHLLQQGGAHLVMRPADALELLEAPARLLHAAAPPVASPPQGVRPPEPPSSSGSQASPTPLAESSLTQTQRAILAALDAPKTLDALAAATGLDAGRLRSDTTVLEIRRLVARKGATLQRT